MPVDRSILFKVAEKDEDGRAIKRGERGGCREGRENREGNRLGSPIEEDNGP